MLVIVGDVFLCRGAVELVERVGCQKLWGCVPLFLFFSVPCCQGPRIQQLERTHPVFPGRLLAAGHSVRESYSDVRMHCSFSHVPTYLFPCHHLVRSKKVAGALMALGVTGESNN